MPHSNRFNILPAQSSNVSVNITPRRDQGLAARGVGILSRPVIAAWCAWYVSAANAASHVAPAGKLSGLTVAGLTVLALLLIGIVIAALKRRRQHREVFDSFRRQHLDIQSLWRPNPAVHQLPVTTVQARVERPATNQPVAQSQPAPQTPAATPKPAPTTEDRPAQPKPQAQTESEPQPRHESEPEPAPEYLFDWTEPSGGLRHLAGMEELKAQIGDAIAPLRSYGSRGLLSDLNGILLSGPPGNGKTAMATAIAGELRLPMLKVGVQDLTVKWINESPAIIRELFRVAASRPCVVFLDEFDAVATSRARDSGSGEDRKVVNALLAEIDKARNKHIVLVAATNFPEQLDPAITRPGRFDHAIEVPYPDAAAREAILRQLLEQFNLSASPETIHDVAALWERRSVAFLASVVKRLRDQRNAKPGLRHVFLTTDDFKREARAVSRRASALPGPQTPLLSELAMRYMTHDKAEELVLRLGNWEEIVKLGGSTVSGILLYGPPGTGKTSFVRSLARTLGDWHVFEVDAAEVLQDPRKLQQTLDLAANHRPAFVFLDEAEELLRDRRKSANPGVTNAILKAVDGYLGKVPEVVFVAATNHPDQLDPAALRGGRFSDRVELHRLWGTSLIALCEQLLAERPQIRLAPEVTAQTLTDQLGEIAPADAKEILSQAVNATFGRPGADGRARPLTLADIRRAQQAQRARMRV